MAYTVLARKYRPQTFADLVGQEHVTRTLGNAIASGRVAHAFLFTGVRGVGKTTTARILAKALQCVNGPTADPCGVCDPCREIPAGVDLDVLEIDGASNTGIDDVRWLQETIPFRPARDRFKIVIIDEVHMLSLSAFNALLKTIEEPPPYLKFIFATTALHKVPITVRSRCQRYDFRMIPQTVIAARVREILAKESIEADEATVAIVAREAAGSMRDALTLLDQFVAFGGSRLVGEEVARVLGIAERDLLHRAAAAILDGQGAEALAVVDALAQRGLDMLHFVRSLTELVRDLVVLRVVGPETELVALPDEERRRAVELGERSSPLELQRTFASLSLLVDEVAKASMPRLTLEMGLVRLATRPPLRAISEIVGRLEALERGLQRPAPTPRDPRGGGGRGGGGPVLSGDAPEGAGAILEKLRAPTGRSAAPATPTRADVAVSAPAGTSAPSAGAPRSAAPSASTAPAAGAPPAVAAPSASTAPARRFSAALRQARAPESSLSDVVATWEQIVIAIRESRPALGAVLEHATPSRLGAGADGRWELVIAFPSGSFYARQADAPSSRDEIARTAERVLGVPVEVRIVDSGEATPGGPTVAELEADRSRARREAIREKALRHPMVAEALAVFEALPEAAEVRVEGD
jgi:DNA polymerase-3 subunit gamma/tau